MRLSRALRSPGLQFAATIVVASCIASSLLVVPGLDGLFGAFLAVLMIAIALVDARYFLIPNELTAAAAALGLLRAGFIGFDAGPLAMLVTLARGLCSALPLLILMLAYRKWRGRDGLGLGDIKLAAVAGVWLSWAMVFVAIELATLTAIAAYFAASRWRGQRYKATALLPFGLFLAPAIWMGWLIEAWLLQNG